MPTIADSTSLIASIRGDGASFSFTKLVDSIDAANAGDNNCGAVSYTLFTDDDQEITLDYLTVDVDETTSTVSVDLSPTVLTTPLVSDVAAYVLVKLDDFYVEATSAGSLEIQFDYSVVACEVVTIDFAGLDATYDYEIKGDQIRVEIDAPTQDDDCEYDINVDFAISKDGTSFEDQANFPIQLDMTADPYVFTVFTEDCNAALGTFAVSIKASYGGVEKEITSDITLIKACTCNEVAVEVTQSTQLYTMLFANSPSESAEFVFSYTVPDCLNYAQDDAS